MNRSFSRKLQSIDRGVGAQVVYANRDAKPILKRSFPRRLHTYDAAVEIGAGIGASLAEKVDMTSEQKTSLLVLGVGGAIATWFFVTGSPWLGVGIAVSTLVGGALIEGSAAKPTA